MSEYLKECIDCYDIIETIDDRRKIESMEVE